MLLKLNSLSMYVIEEFVEQFRDVIRRLAANAALVSMLISLVYRRESSRSEPYNHFSGPFRR